MNNKDLIEVTKDGEMILKLNLLQKQISKQLYMDYGSGIIDMLKGKKHVEEKKQVRESESEK